MIGGPAQGFATERGVQVLASAAEKVAGSSAGRLVTKGGESWSVFLPEGLGGEGFDILNEPDELAMTSLPPITQLVAEEPTGYAGGLTLDAGFEFETVLWGELTETVQARNCSGPRTWG